MKCESIARRAASEEDAIKVDVGEKNSAKLKARVEFLAQLQDAYQEEFENGVALLIASTSEKKDSTTRQSQRCHHGYVRSVIGGGQSFAYFDRSWYSQSQPTICIQATFAKVCVPGF